MAKGMWRSSWPGDVSHHLNPELTFTQSLPLLSPLNMVHSSPHQTAYVLAFGAISGDILSYFFNDTFLSDVAESIAGAGK